MSYGFFGSYLSLFLFTGGSSADKTEPQALAKHRAAIIQPIVLCLG
jgi:hypothetical protein